MRFNFHSLPDRLRNCRAFTMVEIALSIGILAIALVAIAGVLPSGLQVQRDNREDTIIEENGTYLLEAIRNGSLGLAVLRDHVEMITIHNSNSGSEDSWNRVDHAALWNSSNIVGLLSTPKWLHQTNEFNLRGTNTVTAIVRSLNGSAVEQAQMYDEVALRYRATVEIQPYGSVYYHSLDSEQNLRNLEAQGQLGLEEINRQDQLERNLLYEIRITLRWPYTLISAGNYQPAGNRERVFSTVVSGSIWSDDRAGTLPPRYYLAPSTFKRYPSFLSLQ